jgi:hypothetical protein
VRHEIIAMHSAGTPQVYPVCFQAELSGSGSAKPSDTTTFPAAYNLNDMFKTYVISDVSLDHTSFIPPGPAVYGGGGSSGSASENSAAAGGNDTAVASDGAPAQASSQQSSVATSAKAASTGDGGGSEGDGEVTSANVTKGASTVSSSSNTAAVSVEPASSESSISAGLMIWLIFPGQAGAGSTAISAESPGSSGDCMAQMVC